MDRRRFAITLLGGTVASHAAALTQRRLEFPADFGAHPETRIEWWYLTGALVTADGAAEFGFQLTFFRSRGGARSDHPSRFAATQLISAHAAVTDLQAGLIRHDQRIARAGFGLAQAGRGDTAAAIRDWQLKRENLAGGQSVYRASAVAEGFGFDLALRTAQPLLLQGQEGWSRKGPAAAQASHYYSQPQLAATGELRLDGKRLAVRGKAWLDHEWSDTLLDPQAVGWDWIGINLDDGSALTAFQLRRADGSALYAGGSHRRPGEASRSFAPHEVAFEAGRRWTSLASQARYPVGWRVATPVGRFAVRSLLDDQELDSRASTGTVYWEGLSDLLDEAGRRVGRGYLEMTGYAGRMAI